MKNKIYITKKFETCLIILFLILLPFDSFSKELNISANNIKSFVEKNETIFTGNVIVIDDKGNKLFSDEVRYQKKEDKVKSFNNTKITTNNGYKIEGTNIIFDNFNQKITSAEKTQISDKDGNLIFLDMFEYNTNTGFIFSQGEVEVKDIRNNVYQFSQIYIDQQKQQMVGTDVRGFLGPDYKIDERNDPRFFSNSVMINENQREFTKGIFTYCEDKGDDKCPVWNLQAEKIRHDLAKKTIYYDNAVLKFFDFPIFYFPKLFHPDPTVKRQSGLLAPSYADSSNLGSSIKIPYFWDVSEDKDFTITPKLYSSENPLLFLEYRQAFKNSNLVVDTGYTKGYKKIDKNRSGGSRTHFFSKFTRSYEDDFSFSNLTVNVQRSSNDTYLKVHDVDNILAKKELEVLKNEINYFYSGQNIDLGIDLSMTEDLNKKSNFRYEYFLPWLTMEKEFQTSEVLGPINWTSNLQVRNFDVNNQTEFFINDFNWESKQKQNKIGVNTQLSAQLKTVNYNADTEADKSFKTDGGQAELSGVIGYLASLPLIKSTGSYLSELTPKIFFKYAPGHMRDIRDSDGYRLTYDRLYDLNKSATLDIIDKGFSTALGFNYALKELDKDENISSTRASIEIGQIFNETYNFDMPDKTSLNQKVSDLVGSATYNFNENTNIKLNFNLDENYSDVNYTELQTNFEKNKFKFNVSYLEERNHIGTGNYISSGLSYSFDNSSSLSFSTKRNFETNSAEFYNLSYEYINDCLKAGLIFRREFYTDRDLDQEDVLMLNITFRPFDAISSPNLN